MRGTSRRDCADRGSALVEFVLVTPVLLVIAVGVVQVALLMQARATLVAAAELGARAGALSGADADAGARRARALVEQNLRGAVVRRISASRERLDGLSVVTVRIEARVPMLVGLDGVIDVSGHALVEAAP